MKFLGYDILQDKDGYYWYRDGSFETIEECKASILDYVTDEREYYNRHFQEDTPCLEAPWWHTK